MMNNLIRSISILAFVAFSFSCTAQKYNSAIGLRISPEAVIALSAKIPLDKKNALEGAIGVMTPQEDYTVGASVAYHRQFPLNNSRTWQLYLGAGGIGVLGDEEGLGVSGNAGIMWFVGRFNLGLDVYPTYFFDDVLEFKPLFGLHLRWVNK